MANKVQMTEKKGHFEVEFMDGLAGISFHYNSLQMVLDILGMMTEKRDVKSIAWIED